MGLHDPGRFAALAPASGYFGYPFTTPDNICDLKNTPIWAFHGANDEGTPLDAQQQLVDALTACGGKVQFTVYSDAGHDIDVQVYNNQELYTWLFNQHLPETQP
jgi:predicted peptidase